jgi:hypothetical protein
MKVFYRTKDNEIASLEVPDDTPDDEIDWIVFEAVWGRPPTTLERFCWEQVRRST